MRFIHLLPALPDAWAEGSVSGLDARGNFTVSISWKQGKLAKATILSGSGEPCVVRYGDAQLKFKTRKGARYTVVPDGGKLKVVAGAK